MIVLIELLRVVILTGSLLVILALATERRGKRNNPVGTIVVAIIAVGVVLVVGVLSTGGGREKARRINCASNLKSFMLASKIYATDWDEWYPAC